MSAIFLWSVFGFILGSIPFAYLVGRLFVKKDIRTVGDGNPGGSNVWIAGGWRVGLLAAVLDIFKGYLPVYLARRNGLADWDLLPVALAPILGHVLQPFLGFRGGKALGATGGAWLGLIGLRAFPVYASFAVPALAIQTENAWAALAGMFALLFYAFFVECSPLLTMLAFCNVLITIYTHRRSLRNRPRLRPWLLNLLSRRSA